jgi:hypothetical protein
VTWERQRWKGVERKLGDLEHLDPHRRLRAACQAAAVGDDHDARSVGLRDVLHADQARHLDLGADLLAALAHSAGRRVFVVVDKSAR